MLITLNLQQSAYVEMILLLDSTYFKLFINDVNENIQYYISDMNFRQEMFKH